MERVPNESLCGPAECSIGFYATERGLEPIEAFMRTCAVDLLLRWPSRGGRPPLTVPFILDPGWWQRAAATPAVPTQADEGMVPLTLNTYGTGALSASGAHAALAPSGYVQSADWSALRSLVSALRTINAAQIIPFVPTSAAMLTSRHFDTFRATVEPLSGRRTAFLFAGSKEALADTVKLANLRRLVTAQTEPWLVGVDPIVASDVASLVIGKVFVGALSSLRWPAEPRRSNGGCHAKGFMPGLFYENLLSFRSPRAYADWYVTTSAPVCGICGRAIDDYDATDADKDAITSHNVHAIHSFLARLTAQSVASRVSWLQQIRLNAFTAHSGLTGLETPVVADLTLRRLIELDDRRHRATAPSGRWL